MSAQARPIARTSPVRHCTHGQWTKGQVACLTPAGASGCHIPRAHPIHLQAFHLATFSSQKAWQPMKSFSGHRMGSSASGWLLPWVPLPLKPADRRVDLVDVRCSVHDVRLDDAPERVHGACPCMHLAAVHEAHPFAGRLGRCCWQGSRGGLPAACSAADCTQVGRQGFCMGMQGHKAQYRVVSSM